jgi:hypothetical protein
MSAAPHARASAHLRERAVYEQHSAFINFAFIYIARF